MWIFPVIGIVLGVLKLCGVIALSWLWIALIFFGGLAVFLGAFVVVFIWALMRQVVSR